MKQRPKDPVGLKYRFPYIRGKSWHDTLSSPEPKHTESLRANLMHRISNVKEATK